MQGLLTSITNFGDAIALMGTGKQLKAIVLMPMLADSNFSFAEHTSGVHR